MPRSEKAVSARIDWLNTARLTPPQPGAVPVYWLISRDDFSLQWVHKGWLLKGIYEC